jgi:diguanylate cyclase (GGDEF)-like protein
VTDPIGPEIILFTVAGLMLFFAAYAVAHRRIRAAAEFGRLMIAAAIYALGYGLELAQGEIGPMMSAIRFEYLGIATAPAFWLMFALKFSRAAKSRPWHAIALLVIPLVTLVSVWTNDAHHLFYAATWVRHDTPFPVFGFEKAPLYWLNFANIQFCLAAGTIILVVQAVRSTSHIRGQALLAAVGATAPWIGTILYALGLVPGGLEPSSFFLALAGLAFSLAIFRLGFLQLVPAARDKAIESMREGFIVVDSGGQILDANATAARLLGDWVMQENFIGRLREGRSHAAVKGGDGAAPEILGEALKGDMSELEISLDRGRKGMLRLAIQIFPVQTDKGRRRGKGILVRDITETRALLDQLSELAGTDELTGLSNRRRFHEFADKEFAIAVREGRHLAVAILDIDHFKLVNDSYGHAVGDIALKEFATRLAQSIREADILCRYGGEEFAILLPGAEGSSAFIAIERVRRGATISDVVWDGGRFAINASAGVYSAIPDRTSSLDAFLDKADSALYEAKEAGRDRTRLHQG